MKIILLLQVFLVLFYVSGNCQYKKCITEGSEWNVNYEGLGAWNFTQIVSGDTVINGINYKKHLESPSFTSPESLLREDSTNKKIYLYSYSTIEVLLYDFTLTVGDTFPGRHFQIVLDSITNTILYDGVCGQQIPPILNVDNARVFYFHRLPLSTWEKPVVWVEGIGSLVSLLGNDQPWSHQDGLKILCHFDSLGHWDYHYTSCEIDTCLGPIYGSVEEEKPLMELIKIYPNPTAEAINFESTTNEIEKLILYDFLGRRINEYTIKSKAETIPIPNFKQGIYWGVFYFENGKAISRKILIQ